MAMEQNRRSLITSVGAHESTIWIHDDRGERQLSSEGEIVGYFSPPMFSKDGKSLYSMLQHDSGNTGAELWRTAVDSGKSEAVFPGISMNAFDISPDGTQVVYCTSSAGGKTQIWIAPIDRSSPAVRVGDGGELSPHFGASGQILFQMNEGKTNYLEQMNADSTQRKRVLPYPIIEIQGVSPSRKWVMAVVPSAPGSVGPALMAIPLDGGPGQRMCVSYCVPTWSPNGRFLYVAVESQSMTSPGRSLALPIGPGETLPKLPTGGIEPNADASVVPGAQSVPREELVPGNDPARYAYVNTTAHRNLFRISLP